MNIEHGTFIPLVFSISGWMGIGEWVLYAPETYGP